MKVLFIGGTGVISSACSQLALEKGMELYLLTRGKSARPISSAVCHIKGDIRDTQTTKEIFNDHHFDAVVEWVAFDSDHIESDIEIFHGKTNQYIFISSASVYQTPPKSLPVTESTPVYNPFSKYAQKKISCELRLGRAYREDSFPITIVRPSHTYDKTFLPLHGGYTMIDRMRKGKKIVIPGDGTSLWTLTHHKDFARGFVGLIGNPHTIGETYHITSDEILTWNQIYDHLANAAGAKPAVLHIPSQVIARLDNRWGESLLGDKTHSMIFDNSKIKRMVPAYKTTISFWQGAREIISWYDEDIARQKIDGEFDNMLDKLIARYEKL